MLDGSAEPYAAALQIWGTASTAWPSDDGDECCIALQLIWGGLTDAVEIRPEEAVQVETQMLLAAREWLTVEGDGHAEARYFDRWIHDVLGYERPVSPNVDDKIE